MPGMSAREVARELGLSKAMVMLIEHRALAKIGLALGFAPSELGDLRRYIRSCPSCGRLAVATNFPKLLGVDRECRRCSAKRRARARRT